MASIIAVMMFATGVLQACSKDDADDPVPSTHDGVTTSPTDQQHPIDQDDDSTGVDPDDERSQGIPDEGQDDTSSADPGRERFEGIGELTTQIEPGDEITACAESQARLETYRSFAVDVDVAGLPTLQDSLFEFEQILYSAAEEHDWGDRMIENLTNVRRLWATAGGAGDEGSVDGLMREALEYLDKALAVDCPE